LSWLNKKNVGIIVSIVAGTAIAAIALWLSKAMFSSDESLFELTNFFTFVIEIGLGILIAIIIFQYSKFQQSQSDKTLEGIKQVNDRLETEKKTQRETYQKQVTNCLSEIWKKCTLIVLNLNHHKLPENVSLTEIDKITADIIHMNKIQINLALQELNTLTVC
jgi:hypothetical protein